MSTVSALDPANSRFGATDIAANGGVAPHDFVYNFVYKIGRRVQRAIQLFDDDLALFFDFASSKVEFNNISVRTSKARGKCLSATFAQ